jgi:hypothetical protein
MKYLRTFEGTKNYGYWLIPTDERYNKSLDDIGCAPRFKKYDYAHIGLYIYMVNTPDTSWGWMNYNDYSREYLSKERCEYKGMVNITEEEIDQNKYNL